MANANYKSGAPSCPEKLPLQGILPLGLPHEQPKNVLEDQPASSNTPLPDPESPWRSLSIAIYLLYEMIDKLPSSAPEDGLTLAARRQNVFDQQWAYCTQRLHACEDELPTTLEQLGARCTQAGRQVP